MEKMTLSAKRRTYSVERKKKTKRERKNPSSRRRLKVVKFQKLNHKLPEA